MTEQTDLKGMLTTKDNPFNPFTQFEQWYSFDVSNGYNTCAYLARITKSSDALSEDDQTQALEAAIAEIIKFNLTGNYKRVTEEDFKGKPNQSNLV